VRRRKSQANDSLDMLLDTISNTFGGILFLTLLVALLVHFNESKIQERQTQSISNEELTALSKALEKKTASLESFRRALKTQSRTLAQFKPDQSSRLIEEILKLRRKKNTLVQKRIDLAVKFSRQRKANAELDGELQEVGSRHEQAQLDEARLLEELRAEVRKRTRKAGLPALRATKKREFAIVMRYGRLYFLYASELAKQLGSLNYDDFVVLTGEESTIHVTPKPYAGFAINESENLDDLLKQKLVNVDAKEMYLGIAVWEDSFASFTHLRNALVELGWEYRLIPVEQVGIITETHTENPLVQ